LEVFTGFFDSSSLDGCLDACLEPLVITLSIQPRHGWVGDKKFCLLLILIQLTTELMKLMTNTLYTDAGDSPTTIPTIAYFAVNFCFNLFLTKL
jgi:hypothetical protein